MKPPALLTRKDGGGPQFAGELESGPMVHVFDLSHGAQKSEGKGGGAMDVQTTWGTTIRAGSDLP